MEATAHNFPYFWSLARCHPLGIALFFEKEKAKHTRFHTAYLAAAKPGWCDGLRAGERGGGRLRQYR